MGFRSGSGWLCTVILSSVTLVKRGNEEGACGVRLSVGGLNRRPTCWGGTLFISHFLCEQCATLTCIEGRFGIRPTLHSG